MKSINFPISKRNKNHSQYEQFKFDKKFSVLGFQVKRKKKKTVQTRMGPKSTLNTFVFLLSCC